MEWPAHLPLVGGGCFNLSFHTPYDGPNDIMIGNGIGLPITHIGSKILFSSSNSFKLNNVLCVLTIKDKNISFDEYIDTLILSIYWRYIRTIIHIGSKILSSPSNSFKLNNVLCVLTIKNKNITFD